MAENDSGSSARPRRRGRLAFYFLAAAGLIALVTYVFLPVLLRPLIERAVALRVHEPVQIARLSWRPFVGHVEAEGVAVGNEGKRLSADRLSIDVAIRQLLHREIVFDRVILDRPVATIELDEHYRPTLAGSILATGGENPAVPLPMTVHHLAVSHGDVTVRLPLRGHTRDAKLEIDRLAASEVVWTPSDRGLSQQAELDARLDGSPVRGGADLKLGSSQGQVKIELDASRVHVSRNTFDLPPALQAFTGQLD